MSSLKLSENTSEILRILFLFCCYLGHRTQSHQSYRCLLREDQTIHDPVPSTVTLLCSTPLGRNHTSSSLCPAL